MDSGMIGKVEKAHRYVKETDRLQFSQIAVSIVGDNDTHQVRFDGTQWDCSCEFFAHRRTCAHTMTIELLLDGMVPTAAAVA